MPPRFTLEEFSPEDLASRPTPTAKADSAPAAPAPPRQEITPDMVERARLEGYETGYKAGWDDASRAEAENQGRIGADFARNLQDLGFTFHEARSHVMHALEPLLTGMVERVLPELILQTMGQTVVEELLTLAADAADAPIDVMVNPASRAALEAHLANDSSVPFSLVEEPTLAEGQVYLRSGKIERQIDFTTAIERIGAAIDGLYELNEKAFQNG